jgi:hypothetical protein
VIIDFLIVVLVAGAVWAGFQRGMVQPLLAELFTLGTLLPILHNRSTFAAIVGTLFHANGFLAVVIAVILAGMMGYLGAKLGGVIRKMPVVTGADGFVGVWLQALFAIGVCYVLISGIIVMSRTFNSIATPTVNAAQLSTIEGNLGTNAFTSSAVDGHDLRAANAQAARPGGVAISDLPGIGTLQGLNRDLLQSQLAGSRLARFVMNVGRHIPGLGRYGPLDLPARR